MNPNYCSCTSKFLFLFLYATVAPESSICLGPIDQFSGCLKGVPYADENGIILTTKTINLHGSTCPCNASIIPYGDCSYLMAYRENSYRATGRIGISLCFLDSAFASQKTPIFLRNLYLFSPAPRDPRLCIVNKKVYMTYTDVSNKRGKMLFSTACCELALPDKIVSHKWLHINNNVSDKNWTPFVVKKGGAGNKEQLCFIDTFNPLSVVRLDEQHGLVCVYKNKVSSRFLQESWEQRWGKIRGGTPAALVDDEYLTFFHSCIHRGKNRLYVAGAIAFSKDYPHTITRISRYPLIADSFYTRPASPWTWFKRYFPYETPLIVSVFPLGFVEGYEQGRQVFYVTAGDNDSAVMLITLDKEALYKNMVIVNPLVNHA